MTDGAILVAGEARHADAKFHATNPATGERIEAAFSEASEADVADACAAAAQATDIFAALSPESRASFLETCATQIEAVGNELIETASAETGLPAARIQGERGRTCAQLRLFASELRDGTWMRATIDRAMPDREPMPRSDLRMVNKPLGPVAVFGASNFPLAFSVAGGDTASALAAGCPVIVKGHPAHPGTGELVARAIAKAVAEHELPAGVFSYLPGTGYALGAALVADPRIKAVGFTGSRSGGLALLKIAQERDEPIPVYAEMSSINPVVLLPNALANRGAELGQAFVGSLTMGSGQFCTNPGLVVALASPGLDSFVAAASDALAQTDPVPMLHGGIAQSFADGVERMASHDSVERLAASRKAEGPSCADSAIFATTAEKFLKDRALSEEVFGAASLIVRCADEDEMERVLSGLEGQLTATIQMDEGDEGLAARLLPVLSDRAGRVLANGWPTGVEVTHAMIHGGPYPATSAPATTSVGTRALERFLRPVSYQDIPDALLPPPLQDDNPWNIPRRVDGEWQR